MIVTGATLESSAAAIALAHSYPRRLFATAGVHPHHAGELTDQDLPRLRALLREPGVVAAGECGLDYYRNYSPPASQRLAFDGRWRLAAESDGRCSCINARRMRILSPHCASMVAACAA